jgi:uncharacterized protein YxjI
MWSFRRAGLDSQSNREYVNVLHHRAAIRTDESCTNARGQPDASVRATPTVGVRREPVGGRKRRQPGTLGRATRSQPAKGPTVYVIRERFFSIGGDSDITDEHGQPVLHVDGKMLSLRDRLVLRNPAGQEVAQVHRKLVALRPTYQISIGGEPVAEVRKHLFTPFRDRFTIDIPGPDDLEMTGDLFDHEYTVERDGEVVAAVSKRWLTLRDTYAVDVAPGEDDLLILTSVLALDLASDRQHENQRDDD